MLPSEVINRIRALSERGMGSKAIAKSTELSMQLLYKDSLPSPAVIDSRIRALNDQIHAVSQWQAPAQDCRWPVLVKDNIGVLGFRVTAGSFALKELRGVDAFCIRQLRKHGAVPFGKTSMSELAGFVSTRMPPGYSELGGQGINPIDPALSPGGSSSGSAIAVAAGFCHSAIGTETHGSIVIPCIACGVVGIKPSVGLVSREGVIPISHTLDTPGAIAGTVSEAARLLEAIAGRDEQDEATFEYPHAVDFHTDLGMDRSKVRIALATPDHQILDAEEREILGKLIKAAGNHGIEIIEAPARRFETYYKVISSTEIQADFDHYLSKYGNEETPRTFRDLVRLYEVRARHHPFGLDRLTDALTFDPDLNNAGYAMALEKGVGNATTAIETMLREYRAQAIMSVGFLPWWAMARAPCVALPLAQRSTHAMMGIIVGCRRFEDRLAIDLAARLEKVTELIGLSRRIQS